MTWSGKSNNVVGNVDKTILVEQICLFLKANSYFYSLGSYYVVKTKHTYTRGFCLACGFVPRCEVMYVRLITDSKLAIGEDVNGCLSLPVSPVMYWQLLHVYPASRPVAAGDRPHPVWLSS